MVPGAISFLNSVISVKTPTKLRPNVAKSAALIEVQLGIPILSQWTLISYYEYEAAKPTIKDKATNTAGRFTDTKIN